MIDLPTDVRGFTVEKDGCYTIVLNAHLSREMNEKTYEHEMEHISRNDFDSDMDADSIEKSRH